MFFSKKTDKSKEWQGYYNGTILQAKNSHKSVADIFEEESFNGPEQAAIVRKYLNEESVVLEIGCGPGRVSRHIPLHCKKLYCTDILKEALNLAKRELIKYDNVAFKQINGYDLKCFDDNSFDLVYSFGTFFHMDMELVFNYFKEISRVLKSNGIFIVEFKPIDIKGLDNLNGKINKNGINNHAKAPYKFRYFAQEWLSVFAEYFNFEIIDDELFNLAVRFKK